MPYDIIGFPEKCWMLPDASDDGGLVRKKQSRPVVSCGHGFEVPGFALVVEDRSEKLRDGLQHFGSGRPVGGPE